jgi:molybdenum cofactor cytidylyltransferase
MSLAPSERTFAGIVLAAGLSSRMGQPKMLLPWKDSTVLDQLLKTLSISPISELLVVTGSNAWEIDQIASRYHCKTVFNPDFANGSMLVSLQVGLRELSREADAFFLILGDQPFLKIELIEEMEIIYNKKPGRIVIPSFQMRRGHPWLIDSSFKNEILNILEPMTLRVFLKTYEEAISYCVVDEPSILEDMDNPDDYQRLFSILGSI